jgi:hypothetical protein
MPTRVHRDEHEWNEPPRRARDTQEHYGTRARHLVPARLAIRLGDKPPIPVRRPVAIPLMNISNLTSRPQRRVAWWLYRRIGPGGILDDE